MSSRCRSNSLLAAAAFAAAALAPVYAPVASASGLFTAAQAKAGSGVYAHHCAQCHGARLQGMVGPTLKGSGFAAKSMSYTVGGMFGFMSQQMPAGEPGSLSKQQYAEVMAFILKENGYRAGGTKLTYASAKASKVPLISRLK